jgi:hypothetical protein
LKQNCPENSEGADYNNQQTNRASEHHFPCLIHPHPPHPGYAGHEEKVYITRKNDEVQNGKWANQE